MAQQTAVEWLFEQIPFEWSSSRAAFEVLIQAKAMEKEQIIDAYCEGFKISAEGWNGEYGVKDFNNLKEEIEAEQYYNEIYKTQNHDNS